ncbi:MAG: hypothetical protein MH204_09940 [Fimbriimonadaceae bacterium]|nr:hypothetical protein [Fimbriimonadaceae bacterium]
MCLAACAAGAAAGAAQAPVQSAVGRTLVANALEGLQGARGIYLRAEGTERQGEVSRVVTVTAALESGSMGPHQSSWLELNAWRDGRLVQRLAGDGTTLWNWRPLRNTYSSIQYQSSERPRPDHRALMLAGAGRWADRDADFAVRMLRDIFSTGAGLAARWTPWIGGEQNPWVTYGNGTADVIFRADRLEAQIAYRLVDNRLGGYDIGQIWYERVDRTTGVPTLVQWQATLLKDAIPTGTQYGFQPPRGARVVTVQGG